MRALSLLSQLSPPVARAARVGFAAGAVAGLILIGACSDNRDKTITAPQSPRGAAIGSGGFGQEMFLKLCVDASSPNTDYTFVNSELNRNFAQDSWSMALTGNGFWDGSFWSDPGDGGDGTTVANALKNVPYTVAAGGCVTVLQRTIPDAAFLVKIPIGDPSGLGTCDPSTQSCGGVNDAFAAANILYVSNPLSAVYDSTSCLLDEGVLMPQHITNAVGNPSPWPGGGFNSLNPVFANYGCGSHNNPTRAFVNFEHGTTVTFFFSPPTTTPCPAGSFSFEMLGNGDLSITYDQFPAPNDNSYGVNAVGWPNGHTFNNLVGSDHAGIQIKDPNGVVKLSFNLDYITATTGTPSGYASRGPFGGDGSILVGTLTPADITFTTSLAENLNTLGYFTGGVQTVGTGVANLLVNSPPTMNTVDDYTLTAAAAAAFTNGWNFHDTYFATITAAKLASIGFNPATWTVEPNLAALHNSPSKACPPGPPVCDLAVTKTEVKDKQVKITIMNNASTDNFLTALNLTWPSATNGKLTQIKLDGDVIYDNPDIAGGTANLSLAQLVADQNKRKINHNSSDVLTFIFEKNADPVLANYTGLVSFGTGCDLSILP